MKKWAIIGTWSMVRDGINLGAELLGKNVLAKDVVEATVKIVEDNPEYTSVGFGGLPNENGQVELDAAFMDGDTFSVGCVGGIRDFSNPISIAKKLSDSKFNIFLVGSGAEEYAHLNSFERKNMLTENAKNIWVKRQQEMKEKNLSAYDGHDTVCVLALDTKGSICAGTSTSGLFMKKSGRLGDSAIIGSGYYADSEIGAAAATGLGEDIMKGCLSYEVVRRMRDGTSPQKAAQDAVNDLSNKLKKKRNFTGAISVIAVDKNGEYGIGTNCWFSFVACSEGEKIKSYIAKPSENGEVIITEEIK